MFHGTQKRWKKIVSPEKSSSERLFATLELLCFYVSMATLGFTLVQVLLTRTCGYVIPCVPVGLLKVLLAAAVGFLTNWLAIEMLFKPYDPKPWLLIWPQGLIPRNKPRLAVASAEQIVGELINLEELARMLCESASVAIQSDDIKAKIRDSALLLIKSHEDSIAGILIPEIENSLIRIARQHITPENFRHLWDTELAPRLTTEEMKERYVNFIIAGLRNHTPRLVIDIKEWFRECAFDYIDRNIGGIINLGGILGTSTSRMFADGLVDSIDWENVRRKIVQKLESADTAKTVRDILTGYIETLQKWLNTPESTEKMNLWAEQIQDKFHDKIKEFLSTEIQRMIGSILFSPKLWDWINNHLLVQVQPQLEQFLREQAPTFLEQIDFRGMIENAINDMKVPEFHHMIDSVIAEHLGAIQVLGFFLGGIVGVMLLGV